MMKLTPSPAFLGVLWGPVVASLAALSCSLSSAEPTPGSAGGSALAAGSSSGGGGPNGAAGSAVGGTSPDLTQGGSGPVSPKTCSSTHEAEQMAHSVGEAVDGGWNVYTVGDVSASVALKGGPTKFVVHARGSLSGGIWPHLTVKVGSALVGEVDVTSNTWAPYEFEFVAQPGMPSIQLGFSNDSAAGEEDRNLYLDKLEIIESCDGGPALGTGGRSAGSGPVDASNPFAGATLYVDANLPAVAAEQSLRSSGKAADADLMKKIGAAPQATWIGGWSGDPAGAVRGALDQGGGNLRVLVAYNIYNRDCGNLSSGGVANAAEYKSWIDAFASGIGSKQVAIVLEPDTLAHDCDPTRWEVLSYAVTSLKKQAGAHVYLDAGHAGWVDAGTMSGRLKTAGIANADGFALNVSSFQTTSDSIGYGLGLSGQVGGKPFVIDTSRNGKGPAGGEWCNPAGRGLGDRPTANTGNPLVHAFLWIKHPGESDGTCNGGPAAGQWFEAYALSLAANAVF